MAIPTQHMLLGPCLAAAMIVAHATTDRVEAARTVARTTVAPATVSCLNRVGLKVQRVRAKTVLRCRLSFTAPATFPPGYTDIRFQIAANGRPQTTIIDGTPRRLHARQTVQVDLPVMVSRSWRGTVTITGTLTMLSRPGGTRLPYTGMGKTTFAIVR